MSNNPSRATDKSYAFSQPNTANSSSSAIRQQETETFYQPLPSRQNQPAHNFSNTQTNPFTDSAREYISRTPSPNASNPLLSGTSPISPDRTMPPNPVREYVPPSRAAAGAMPQRGESQNALLGNGNGDNRQVSRAETVPFFLSTFRI